MSKAIGVDTTTLSTLMRRVGTYAKTAALHTLARR